MVVRSWGKWWGQRITECRGFESHHPPLLSSYHHCPPSQDAVSNQGSDAPADGVSLGFVDGAESGPESWPVNNAFRPNPSGVGLTGGRYFLPCNTERIRVSGALINRKSDAHPTPGRRMILR
jgi:hypothetical protein